MKKIKTGLDVYQDFQSEGAKDIKGFKTKLDDAISRFHREQKQNEKQLPKFAEVTFDQIKFNYGVQRDLNEKHVLNIVEGFDPRVVRYPSAVKDSDGFYYVFDGQHTLLAMQSLGFTKFPITYVETNETYFDAVAFEILNDTGIQKADKAAIHRGLLYRYSHGDKDPRVMNARALQNVMDRCKIDLQPARLRKSANKKGDNKHFFSHFDYAEKGLEMTNPVAMEKILLGIKEYYGNEDNDGVTGNIDRALFIGLCKMFNLAKSNDYTLPDNWVAEILKALKTICGSNAANIHSACKRQWQHTRGTSWDAPVAMCVIMREVYLLLPKEDQKFQPPFIEKVKVLRNDQNQIDLHTDMKPFIKIN
tara:strand:+ start:148 stop:1233 length:1086 start_codon:yes stop_codon:yes gene_type:complete